MWWSQTADRPSRGREDNALYRPGVGLRERGTHAGWVRGRSLTVEAAKHPVLAGLAVTGLGLALGGALRRPAPPPRRGRP